MQRERDPRIVEEFGRRRRRQLMLVALLIPALIWLSWVMEHSGQVSKQAQGPIVMALVVAALAYSWKNWRCPACNRYMGKSAFLSFCPACGVPLK